MLAAVALLLVLKDQFGLPHTGIRSMLFLAVFGYGCSLIYVLMLCASPWFPILKKLTFPDAWKNTVFRTGMAFSAYMLNVLIGAAVALFVFGANPSGTTGILAAMFALTTAAATMPLTRRPETAAAP